MIGWLLSFAGSLIVRFSSAGILQEIGRTLQHADDNKAQVAIAEINAEIESRRTAKEIRVATSGFWEMRLITFVIAACFTTHLTAVSIDTVFALGWKIAKFPAPFDQWEGAILLSFFGVQTVGAIGRGVVAAMLKR